MKIRLEQAERLVLDQVKFLNLTLHEARKRNEILHGSFGMTYGKLIGLGTPYEQMIRALREVKSELDNYLKLLRAKILEQYGERSGGRGRR